MGKKHCETCELCGCEDQDRLYNVHLFKAAPQEYDTWSVFCHNCCKEYTFFYINEFDTVKFKPSGIEPSLLFGRSFKNVT